MDDKVSRSDPYVNQPVRAPRAGDHALLERWQEIERGFSRADRTAYRHAWGMAREDFCTKYGVPPISEADVQRLRELKGSYAGRRIFVVGNGPSINKMPLHLLKNEFTFGVNRIYLLFDRIRWKPSFYTANDWRVVPDIADEISALSGMTFFFDQRFRGLLREGSDVYWYEHRGAPRGSTPLGRGFSSDLTTGARGAGSVVGTAVQIAFYLGFDPIYLVGCDLGYTVPATVIQEGEDKFGTGVKLQLTSTKDDDPNHFDPRYFGMGKRWHDPNVKRMIEGHIQCRRAIDAAGRRIFNATLGGQLEVYERVDFLSLFDSARNEPAPSPTKQADGWPKGLRWPQVKVARYSLYYRVASYLQRNHPSIARVGRFALWSLRAIRRQLFGAGGVFLLAVTGLLLASLLVERHSALLAGVAFTGILACFSLLVLGFAEHSFKRYIDQRERLWKKRLAEQEKRETQLRKMNEPNANLLHRLDGQVDRKHLAKLQKDWFPRLGLSLTSEALGYIVRRITSMEDRCTGRLATAVSTEVLRCLVARSITGSSLDILEIGTLFGVNVACMYELCRDFFEKLHVTMIDPLYGYYGPSTLDVLVKIPVTRQVLDRNLNAAGIPESDYTVIQRMSTDTEAISRAKRRQYDLLLIDGDHSEEGVAKDFCAYGPMVKAGGYILFDDYNVPEWPAVKNFVDREVVGREDLEFIGAAWRTAVFKVQVSS